MIFKRDYITLNIPQIENNRLFILSRFLRPFFRGEIESPFRSKAFNSASPRLIFVFPTKGLYLASEEVEEARATARH